MFEGFVYQLLAGYLGHYVKDIQREQLRIGLWSGVALLENVEIRLEAFDYLQLPFAIQSGTIGKLRLQVPWKRLGWDPIIVALEDVVLTSGPREDAEWEAGPAEKRALAAKKAKLAAAELRKLSERVSEDKSGQSFMSYLSAKIIDNIQVAVKNIHIKYEDPHTHPEGPFAFGIVLSGLNLRSAEGWQLTASNKKKGASNFVHKLIEVDKLGVYWNSQGDLREKRRRRGVREPTNMSESEFPIEEYAYLMRPVDVKMKLAINKSATLDKSTPQHSVSIDVEGLSFALEELQFQEMLLLLDSMSIYELREKYGKFRPCKELMTRSPARSGQWARAWWQYAIRAVRLDIHARIYRPTWRYLSWRRDMRKRYVAIYKKKLDRVRHGQAPDATDVAQLEKMEEELEVEDITFFRSWAEGQTKVEAAALSRRESIDSSSTEHAREQQGWLSWVSWGLLGAGGSSIDAGGFTGAISDKDLKELYKAMDFYPSLYAEDSTWTKEYCHTALALTVQEALFSLRSSYSKRDIMQASLRSADISVRSRRDSTSLSLTLGSLEAQDLCSPGSTFSRILCPKNSSAPIPLDTSDASSIQKLNRSHSYTVESPTGSWANLSTLSDDQELPLVRIECELHPEELNVDVRFLVAIQPLEVVYSPAFIKRAAMFFNHPASVQTHQELVVSALNGLDNLRARTISKAEYVFSTRMRTSFQINVHAPLLIIPEAGQEKGSTLLVVDLGLLQLTSGAIDGGRPSSRKLARQGVGSWSQEELREGEPSIKRSASFPDAPRSDGSRSNSDVLKEITDSALYDRFDFEVKDLQVAVARQSSDWRAILEQDGWDAQVHLVNRFDLKLTIDNSSLPSDTTITKTKILGTLPTVYCHLSVCKLQSFRTVLDSLSRPEAILPTAPLASSIFQSASPLPPLQSSATPTPPAGVSPFEKTFKLPTEDRSDHKQERPSFAAPKGGSKQAESNGQVAPLIDLQLAVAAAAVEISLGEALAPHSFLGGGAVDGKVVVHLANACLGFKQLLSQSVVNLVLGSCHIEDFSKPLHSPQRLLLSPSNLKTPSEVFSFHVTCLQDSDGSLVSNFSVQMGDFIFQCNRATLAALVSFSQAASAENSQPTDLERSFVSSMSQQPQNVDLRSSLTYVTPVKASPMIREAADVLTEKTRVKASVEGSLTIAGLEIHFNTVEETVGIITAADADVILNLESLGEDVRWMTEGSFGSLSLDAPVEKRGQTRLWDAAANADRCRHRFVVGTLGLEALEHATGGSPRCEMQTEEGRPIAEKQEVKGCSDKIEEEAEEYQDSAETMSESRELEEASVSGVQYVGSGLKIFFEVEQVHAILFGEFITKATAFFTHEEWSSSYLFAEDTPTLSGLSEEVVLSVAENEGPTSEPQSSTVVYEFSIRDCILEVPTTLESPESRAFPQVTLPHLTVRFSLLGDSWTAENEDALPMLLSVEGNGLSLATWPPTLETGPEQRTWEGASRAETEPQAETQLCQLIEGLGARFGMKWFKKSSTVGCPSMRMEFDAPSLRLNLTKDDVTAVTAVLEHNLLKMDFSSEEPSRPESPTGRPARGTLSRAVLGSEGALLSSAEGAQVASGGNDNEGSTTFHTPQRSDVEEALLRSAKGEEIAHRHEESSKSEGPMQVQVGVGEVLVSFSEKPQSRQQGKAALVCVQKLALAADITELSGSLRLTWRDVSIRRRTPLAQTSSQPPKDDTWLDERHVLLLQLQTNGDEQGVQYLWGKTEIVAEDLRVSVSESRRSSCSNNGALMANSKGPHLRVTVPEASVWVLLEDWAAAVSAITTCVEMPSEQKNGGALHKKVGETEPSRSEGQSTSDSFIAHLRVDVTAPNVKLILPSAVRKEWEEESGTERIGDRFHNRQTVYDSDSEPDDIQNPNTPLQPQFSGQFSAHDSWQAEAQRRPTQTAQKSCVVKLDVRGSVQQSGDTWQMESAVEQAVLTAETRQPNELTAALPLLRVAAFYTSGTVKLSGRDEEPVQPAREAVDLTAVGLDAEVTLGAVESWCSFPIVRFFRDFDLNLGAAPESDNATTLRGRIKGRLGRASFRLSDCRWFNNAPILELLLSEIQFLAQTDTQVDAVSVAADVIANYHNIEKVAWEPLLEPYSLTFDLERKISGGAAGKVESQTSIEVASTVMLNVNISEALAKATMRASDVIREGFEYGYDDQGSHVGTFEERPADPSQKRRYAPYWLKNETGVTMRYWLSSSPSVTTSVTASGSLPAGKSAPIYVEEDPADGQGLGPNPYGHVQHRMIEVQLEGSGVRSPLMSIDRVGGHVFPITFIPPRSERLTRQTSAFPTSGRGPLKLGRQSSDFPVTSSRAGDDVRVNERVLSGLSLERTISGTPQASVDQFRTRVVCEVQLRRYSKLVVLKSMVSLTNKTSVPLDLCFEMPFALEGKVLGPIPPGQTFPFPIHQAGGSGRVRWRPSGDTHFWSEAQVLSNLLKSSDALPNPSRMRPHRSIVCAPNRPQGKPFRFCMDVGSSELPTLESVPSGARRKAGRMLASEEQERRMWAIQLLPPVTIENGLPCAVTLTAKMGSTALVEETSIPQGQSAHIFEADSHQELRLTFQPARFGVTSIVKVPRVATNAPEMDGLESLTSLEVMELTAEYSGAKISIELETTVSLVSGTRHLFLSCGYWIFNCTDLQLVFQGSEAFGQRSDAAREQPLPPASKTGLLRSPVREHKARAEADAPFERKRSWPDAAGLEVALTSIPESHSVQDSETMSVRSSPFLSRGDSSAALSSYFDSPVSKGTVFRQGANASASILPPVENASSPTTAFQTPKRLSRQEVYTPTGMREGSEFSFGGVETPASSRPGSPFSYASTPRTLWGGSNLAYSSRSLQGARSLYGLSSTLDFRAVMYGRPTRSTSEEPQLRIRVMKPAQKGAGLGHVAASEWSKPFGLDPAGGVSVVHIPRWKKKGLYVLAVSSIPAMGACVSKTKTVTIRPRYVLVNALQQDLVYKQQGTESYQHLAAGQHRPFHWTDVKRNFRVCLRYDENGWDWSGGFAPDQLGDILLKMRQQSNRAITMVRVDVSCPDPPAETKMAGGGSRGVGTCVVVISEDKGGFVPYRIDNFSTETVRFRQERCEESDDLLRPYSSCAYAWDEPCRPHRLIMTVPGAGKLGTFSLDKVWQYPRLHLLATTQRPERTLQVFVRADGPTRVISVSDVSMHQWEDPESASNASKMEATGPSDVMFEVTLKLAGIGVSVIDTTPQELLYGCARGIQVRCARGTHEQMGECHVASLQLDNQLRHATYPVLLSTLEPEGESPKGDSDSRESLAALSGRVMHWRRQTGSVDCFRLVVLRVAPLRLEIEERLVVRIIEFVSALSQNPKPSPLSRLADESESGSWADLNVRIHTSAPGSVASERILSSAVLTGPSDGRTSGPTHPSAPGSVASEKLLSSGLSAVLTGPSDVRTSGPIHTSAPGSVASERILSTAVLTGPSDVRSIASGSTSEGVHTSVLAGLSSVVLTGPSDCGPQPAAVAFVGGPNWDVWTLVHERRKIYIETLHVHAIDLRISFVSAPWLPWEIRGAAARGMLGGAGIALQRRVMALADLEDAPVHLGPLRLEHPLASYGTLWGMVIRHYTRQVLQGVYKVLGSADFLGNPVGFFQSVGSGLWDFVTTPAASLVQSPREFTSSVAHGTRSLFNNTVFAFSNAASRLSGAARKGVQTWALEREYIEEMERRRREENGQGGGVLQALLEGLTGVLEQPVRGAESSGLAGMVAGTGKGLVGLVAKPTASILEIASRTAQSIRNATRGSWSRATRVRPPRQVSAEAPLTKYLREEAVGRAVLLEAEGGWYKNEAFSQCFPLAEPGEFLVLSESRLLSVESASYRPAAKSLNHGASGREWTVQWEIAFKDILHVQTLGKVLRVLAMSPALTSKPAKTSRAGTPPKAAPYVHKEISFEEEGAAEYLRKHLMEQVNKCDKLSSLAVKGGMGRMAAE